VAYQQRRDAVALGGLLDILGRNQAAFIAQEVGNPRGRCQQLRREGALDAFSAGVALRL